jgi:GNAT superfamily N-acetyltransferase
LTTPFELVAVTEADFEDLLALRIDVMRPSLERLGRFDPQRARERFRGSFDAVSTWRIRVGGENAGCVALKADGDALRIDHFYLAAPWQQQGLGAAVLKQFIEQAKATRLPLRVAALVGSDANRFYERHGFVPVSRSEWDIEYVHAPTARDGR